MKEATLGLALAAACLLPLWLGIQLAPTKRVIDCSMAEFHPDFTPEMRKACRDRMRVNT